MPGPLASAHGAIENCSACHTKSGSGKLSWIHGLVAGDPLADSKACLTCHKMPDTAFNAHSALAEVLKQSTKRLTKIAAKTPAPQWAHTQDIAFPTDDVVARGLYCATCHQEHQGVTSNLSKISNERCRSCHVVKFDSFDGHHPKFENYPFERRTRIIYDHAEHFAKHFPEVAKKYPARRIPETCSACHNSREDKRVMAVAPFEETCTGCHLDDIIGKERASGPKGIAFLTLPGLDLQTLKAKDALIGEWPDASEAELTPFMKVMIGRDERGRALIETVDRLNLQDLTDASDDQIAAVTNLVWEIKGLFYALITGKASDVLADLNIGTGAKLSADLVADLTAGIPRDVVISAYQQWLPNLATELASGRDRSQQNQTGWRTAISVAESAPPAEPSDADAEDEAPEPGAKADNSETASIAKLDPPVCTVGFLGQCLVSKGREEGAGGPRLKQQSLKQQPEKPMARTPGTKVPYLAMPSPRRTQMRRPKLRRTRMAPWRMPRNQPSLKERLEKPISRTPRPMAIRRRSRLTNGLRKRPRTKPTICFPLRRKSFVRSKPMPRTRREEPGPEERAQISLRMSLKQALHPASKATWIRRAGPNMAAGTGRTTRFSTVPRATRTNSSTPGSPRSDPKRRKAR